MKISRKWLADFISIPKSDITLESNLTNLGLEVDSIVTRKDDSVIDIEFTPNRGDCLSVYGTARDLSAISLKKIHLPKLQSIKTKKAKDNVLKKIEHNICPEYRYILFNNINNSFKTPDYIKQRLKDSNIAPINLFVDVSNYVLMELGQPTHAFDFDKIDSFLSIKNSSRERKFLALDNKEYTIPKNTPVITDKSGLIHALPGVIGSKYSSVTKTTKNILVESAFFVPDVVRKLSSQFRIQTDSSYRFERGVDYNLQEIALKRIHYIISEIFTLDEKPIIFKRSNKHPCTKVKSFVFDKTLPNRILGVHIDHRRVVQILKHLGFTFKNNRVHVPSHRFDVDNNYDLVEEIARIYGYENIPESKLDHPDNSPIILFETYKQAFVYRGYKEAINFSFISDNLNSNSSNIPLVNPISKDKSQMRDSLLQGLLNNISYNSKRKQKSIKLFEEGRTFKMLKNKIVESDKFSAVIYGQISSTDLVKYSYNVGIDDLKSDILSAFPEVKFKRISGSTYFFDINYTQQLILNNKLVGYCGLVAKEITDKLDINGPVFAFEIDNINSVKCDARINYNKISQYPSVYKDLTIKCTYDHDITEITRNLNKKSYKYLKNIRIKDIFIQGDNLQSNNMRHVTIEICLQSKSKTLSDADINKDLDMVIKNLKTLYNLHIKES